MWGDTNHHITADDFVEKIMVGSKLTADNKEHYRKQLKMLAKYHNLSPKKLAERAKVAISLVKKFKSLYAEGYRVK